MATFVFGMNLSLDGYVNHEAFAPDATLFRHWIDQVRGIAGGIYGRGIYQIMRYWDEDQPGWGEAEHDFATAWRAQPKWVVSRTLTSVGPSATLISQDFEATVRAVKTQLSGEIDVSGPVLAHWLGTLGLIDEYRLYLHPVVLGGGAPFFAGPRPPLRLVSTDRFSGDVIRLTYAPG